jgi:hypothetical protein
LIARERLLTIPDCSKNQRVFIFAELVIAWAKPSEKQTMDGVPNASNVNSSESLPGNAAG